MIESIALLGSELERINVITVANYSSEKSSVHSKQINDFNRQSQKRNDGVFECGRMNVWRVESSSIPIPWKSKTSDR